MNEEKEFLEIEIPKFWGLYYDSVTIFITKIGTKEEGIKKVQGVLCYFKTGFGGYLKMPSYVRKGIEEKVLKGFQENHEWTGTSGRFLLTLDGKIKKNPR